MTKNILADALGVSVESYDGEYDESYVEEVEGLAAISNDHTPESAEADVVRTEADLETVNELVEAAEGADQTSLESLTIALDVIMRGYGIKGTRASLEGYGDVEDARREFLATAAQFQASLESALEISMESWSVKDLWDASGALERRSGELAHELATLRKNEKYISDHGTVINSWGQLIYVTVDNEPTKDIVKDTKRTADHLQAVIRVADTSLETADRIRKLVEGAKVQSDEDAVDLLNKVVALKNPAIEGRKKLHDDLLLGNARTEFNLHAIKNKHDFKLKEWSDRGVYYVIPLGRGNGSKNHAVTKWLTIPAWLVGANVGTAVGKAVGQAVGLGAAGTAAVGLAHGIAIGNLAYQGINAVKASLKTKHRIDVDKYIKSLETSREMADKVAAKRRELPGAYKRSITWSDSTKKKLKEMSKGLGSEGKAALSTVREIYGSAERLSWGLYQQAFSMVNYFTTHNLGIAKKLNKSVKN